MGKQRLFQKLAHDDKREPHERFSDLASKVVAVPKSEIDEREKSWRRRKKGKESSRAT